MLASFKSFGQAEEIEQLLLDVEKLGQFKEILSEMKEGFDVVYKGYNSVKEISSGNFNLHKIFLDGLMEVSPVVRKYKRVADIINYQLEIVKACKGLRISIGIYDFLDGGEKEYCSKVFGNLARESIKNLDELLLVIGSGELRMSDDERINAIDRVYKSVAGQFSFLKSFKNSLSQLTLQRKYEKAEIELSRKINGY